MGFLCYPPRQGCSRLLTLVIEVSSTGEDGKREVELVEVRCDEEEPEPGVKRSHAQWFYEDHWLMAGSDCVWPNGGVPDDGAYVVKGKIIWSWTSSPDYGEDYDEEFEVDSIEKQE